MDLTGAGLSRLFWADAVAPLLAAELPRLRYAAGRFGTGSDVLGLDDAMSRDHDWGCRLTVLVDSDECDAVPTVRELLARQLPASYRGHTRQTSNAMCWPPGGSGSRNGSRSSGGRPNAATSLDRGCCAPG